MSLRIFSLRCPALAEAQHGEEEERKKDTYKKRGRKKTTRSVAENQMSPIPQNRNEEKKSMKDDCASLTAREPELELRSDSAQLPAGLSEGHATRPRVPPAHEEGGLQSRLAHQRLPSLSPTPHTARLLLP